MKRWNIAEIVELEIASTADGKGNSGVGSTKKHDWKCECTQNGTWKIISDCPDCGGTGVKTDQGDPGVVTDKLS